jgi:hypothetical protein
MSKEPMTMQTDTQPVDLRDWGYAPGHYSMNCRDCTKAALHICAAKHSWRCKDCATKAREASLAAAKSTAAQPVDSPAADQLRNHQRPRNPSGETPVTTNNAEPAAAMSGGVDIGCLLGAARALSDSGYPINGAIVENAAAEIRALRAQIKSFRGVFTKLDKDENHAPGHAHRFIGIWDDDVGNADKAGNICEWCAEWNSARVALGDAK